ncbi:MAG: hypothetical protein ACI9AT_001253 [Ulvibacter sp.]
MIHESDHVRRNLVVTSFFFLVYLIGDASFKITGNVVTIGLIGIELHRIRAIEVLSVVMFIWFWWRYTLHHPSIIQTLRKELENGSKHRIYLNKRDPENTYFAVFLGRLALHRIAKYNDTDHTKTPTDVGKGCSDCIVTIPTSNWWKNTWFLKFSGEQAELQDGRNIKTRPVIEITDTKTKLIITAACTILTENTSNVLFPHFLAAIVSTWWFLNKLLQSLPSIFQWILASYQTYF